MLNDFTYEHKKGQNEAGQALNIIRQMENSRCKQACNERSKTMYETQT